jgi:diguanylate cyclase (GGDEF)-like protein
LLNRSGFEAYVEPVFDDGRGASLGLVLIDLDHFKPVNDLHGHPVGDAVLREFGQRLSRQVRPTDAVARLGGDEFAVALAGVREPANAYAVARKIIAVAKLPFEIEGLILSVGASAGVAVGADAGGGFANLMARADASLYRAKRAGRGRWEGVASG